MATSLIRVTDDGDSLNYGAFTMTKTGLVVQGAPTFDDWQACGHVLRRIEGAVQLWIGDWLKFGKRYGETYTQAVEATGMKDQTLMNYAYVASRIEISRRRENLSFAIHAEVAPLEPAQQDRILDRAEHEGLTTRAVRDIVRQEAHASKVAAIESGALPAGEFDVICADPPWQYENSGFDQSAANHYPTMATEAIGDLPSTSRTFPKFADPCVLFLWATSPLLPAALTVLDAWGFDYRACLVWVKDRAPGVGWWLHTRHELLLIGVRGSTTPLERVDSVIEAAVDAHSRKPIEAYDAIDRMFPGVRRVECFARTPRPGWSVWGNEV
jgi:N6-adenosine-specific RNA methylase IME4